MLLRQLLDIVDLDCAGKSLRLCSTLCIAIRFVKGSAGSRSVNVNIYRRLVGTLRTEHFLPINMEGDISLDDQVNVHGVSCINPEQTTPTIRLNGYILELDLKIGCCEIFIGLNNIDDIVTPLDILILNQIRI